MRVCVSLAYIRQFLLPSSLFFPVAAVCEQVRQLHRQLRLAASGVVPVASLDGQRFDQSQESLNMARYLVTLRVRCLGQWLLAATLAA